MLIINGEISLSQDILSRVERPGQYIGNEYNTVQKDWQKTKIKMAFLFPDTYEIGMSYLGLRLLYEVVNSREDALLERSFAPQTDMEKLMREQDLLLFSWESHRPVKDFDVIGFTMQYELSYTNILNMLDLAGLPVLASERHDWPLVIAGGPTAYNPEPLSDFIDLFVIGEGEEVLLDLLALVEQVKNSGGSKEELLNRAVSIDGIYIPSFYDISYHKTGKISAVIAKKNAPSVIKKRILGDIDNAVFPHKGIIPHVKTVHDRIMLELMRGCSRGCRFCQAGMIYRPVREKSLATLIKQAEELAYSTGYDEIGLMSLSSADYSRINDLVDGLLTRLSSDYVNVSLPSLRADALSVKLAAKVQEVRKSGITFAPEAGSQRLRDIINKGIIDDNILEATRAAFSQGWSNIKLYFMIGLPGETDEDILGIAQLCRKIIDCARQSRPEGRKKPLKISLGVASFVPKADTPFQWRGQDSTEEIMRKQRLLRDSLRPLKQVSLSCHNVNESVLESVFARGDRLLGKVLLLAWQKGCRFDGWSEYFRFDIWQEAFEEVGLNINDYAGREYDITDILPWDHISSGVDKSWLWQENLRASEGLLTKDCREQCSGCGVCNNLKVDPVYCHTGEIL